MKIETLKNIWYAEEQYAFSGWDFSHLDSRWNSEPLPWDYKNIVQKYLLPQHQLLDIGTGGGEFLLSLEHPYKNTSVTESWKPNIALCKKQLSPLGIRVYPVQNDAQLPIEDNMFDIVINKQASYDLHEVSRVLRTNGVFITQQVGANNNRDLARRLNPSHPPIYSNFSLSTELPKFESNGFTIKYSNESYPGLRFFDIGALVFWARIIKWEFPEFSVDNNFNELCALQDELLEKGFVQSSQHRFIFIAQKNE